MSSIALRAGHRAMAGGALLLAGCLVAMIPPAVAANAAEIGNGLGIRIILTPPDPSFAEVTEGAIISAGNRSPVLLRIDRAGGAISIYNDQAAFVCRMNLRQADGQTCFGKDVAIDAVLPLSRFGAAAHPFVVSARIGGWPVAIYAGLNGVAARDRCTRFIATVSAAAGVLARAVCPGEVMAAPEPIQGAELDYAVGAGWSGRHYAVRIARAVHGDWHCDVSEDGSIRQWASGALGLSHILRQIVRCDRITQAIYDGAQESALSCSRTYRDIRWRDTFVLTGVRTLQDQGLSATMRAYTLSIAGTADNTHRSTADIELWLELGVPFRTRYIVLAGLGPDGLAPRVKYTETLSQVVLPAP